MKSNTIFIIVAVIFSLILTVVFILGGQHFDNYNKTFNQGCYPVGTIGFEACHNGTDVAMTYMDNGVRERASVPTTSLLDEKAEVTAEVLRIKSIIANPPTHQDINCVTLVHVERNVVYVNFAPCKGQGGVGQIFTIDAKFWSAEVAAQFSK